jgi:hypothetical protein
MYGDVERTEEKAVEACSMDGIGPTQENHEKHK